MKLYPFKKCQYTQILEVQSATLCKVTSQTHSSLRRLTARECVSWVCTQQIQPGSAVQIHFSRFSIFQGVLCRDTFPPFLLGQFGTKHGPTVPVDILGLRNGPLISRVTQINKDCTHQYRTRVPWHYVIPSPVLIGPDSNLLGNLWHAVGQTLCELVYSSISLESMCAVTLRTPWSWQKYCLNHCARTCCSLRNVTRCRFTNWRIRCERGGRNVHFLSINLISFRRSRGIVLVKLCVFRSQPNPHRHRQRHWPSASSLVRCLWLARLVSVWKAPPGDVTARSE